MLRPVSARTSKSKTARSWPTTAGQQGFFRTKPGELAGFDEALESLVEQYPQKDTSSKRPATGRRFSPVAAQAGQKTMKRDAFSLPVTTATSKTVSPSRLTHQWPDGGWCQSWIAQPTLINRRKP
jgi:hypothetical protein